MRKQLYGMKFIVEVDHDQTDKSDRGRMPLCPVCGQKLMEVESIFHKGVFRLKCRRCRKFIRLGVQEDNT